MRNISLVNFVVRSLKRSMTRKLSIVPALCLHTLDPVMQDKAQQLVTDQVAMMVDSNAHNGALVAIRPSLVRSSPWSLT